MTKGNRRWTPGTVKMQWKKHWTKYKSLGHFTRKRRWTGHHITNLHWKKPATKYGFLPLYCKYHYLVTVAQYFRNNVLVTPNEQPLFPHCHSVVIPAEPDLRNSLHHSHSSWHSLPVNGGSCGPSQGVPSSVCLVRTQTAQAETRVGGWCWASVTGTGMRAFLFHFPKRTHTQSHTHARTHTQCSGQPYMRGTTTHVMKYFLCDLSWVDALVTIWTATTWKLLRIQKRILELLSRALNNFQPPENVHQKTRIT